LPREAGPERRRAERKKVNRPITVVVDSSREQLSDRAFALDLSDLGVRVRSSLSLVRGQVVTVIPREGNDQAFLSQVIWVGTRGSDSSSEAGIAFLQSFRRTA
jgi:hypothetical protein